MNGILLIDKPAGMSSHAVVSKLRKKLQTKKIGHAGTLDPSASGLLVICVGYATKISGYVMESDKVYETRFILGRTTTTYDMEGEVVSERDAGHITEKDILAALSEFRGNILQRPPIYSAIKIKGKKLYQYARSNTQVDIPERIVTVHDLRLLKLEKQIGSLRIECSKGTYVRSLVHDLGEKLGVGATVETIHRNASAPFSIEGAVSLEALLEMEMTEILEKLIPVAKALQSKFHPIVVSDGEEALIRNGVEYPKRQISKPTFTPESLFVFVSKSGNEIAIAKWGLKDTISYLRIL